MWLWEARSLAEVQTGEKNRLRSMSGLHLPTNPWPKTEEFLSKKNAFAFAKRKTYWQKPEHGNSWDQYEDSSSAASASASAEEGGRGVSSKIEKTQEWGP